MLFSDCLSLNFTNCRRWCYSFRQLRHTSTCRSAFHVDRRICSAIRHIFRCDSDKPHHRTSMVFCFYRFIDRCYSTNSTDVRKTCVNIARWEVLQIGLLGEKNACSFCYPFHKFFVCLARTSYDMLFYTSIYLNYVCSLHYRFKMMLVKVWLYYCYCV